MKLIEIESKTIDPKPYWKNLHYYFRKGHFLYRGTRFFDTVTEIDYSGKYRSAKNTDDLYKQILDKANPSWPRRGYSTVCTTDEGRAEDYGNVNIIIPRDNTVIAAVGLADFWDTGTETINQHFGLLRYLLRIENIHQSHGVQSSLTETLDMLEKSREVIIKENNTVVLEQIFHQLTPFLNEDVPQLLYKWYKNEIGSIKEFLNKLLDVCRYPNISSSFTKSTYIGDLPEGECWFEGPFLLIPMSKSIDEVKDILGLS